MSYQPWSFARPYTPTYGNMGPNRTLLFKPTTYRGYPLQNAEGSSPPPPTKNVVEKDMTEIQAPAMYKENFTTPFGEFDVSRNEFIGFIFVLAILYVLTNTYLTVRDLKIKLDMLLSGRQGGPAT